MKLLPGVRLHRLGKDGFSIHVVLPILVILVVAGIGVWMFKVDYAASNYYKGPCTGKTYAEGSSNACVNQVKDLLDGLQHAGWKKYVTATSATEGTFAYGKEHYLDLNKSYDASTETALKKSPFLVSSLTTGTSASDGWQKFCTNVANSGMQLTTNKNDAKLNFHNGNYTNDTMGQIFTATCGKPTSTSSTSGGTTTSGGTSGGSGTTGSTTGFITASGMKLMLNGAQYRSISFDFSPLGDCWDSNWTTAQMDTFFAAIPKGSMARFFAPPDSDDSASFVESIVAQADKYDDHLIIALADADVDNNCDTENASNNGKTAAYYTDAPESGSTWYNWVQSVVKPLANDPGVAIWEISNEPMHAGVNLYDGQVTQAAFDTYVKDGAADIKAAEVAGAGSAKQLITIAPADMGDIDGGTESNAQTVFSYLNIVDDHDYSFDADSGSPAINADFATEEQVAKALNKPFMVDEAGVEAGSCSSSTLYNAWDNGSNGTTLANRATLLITDKATDYFNNGNSAIDFWLYTGQSGGCSYENINPSDPIMAAAKNYKIP